MNKISHKGDWELTFNEYAQKQIHHRRRSIWNIQWPGLGEGRWGAVQFPEIQPRDRPERSAEGIGVVLTCQSVLQAAILAAECGK